MRRRKTMSIGTFGLIGTLGIGCANLVGADFEREFAGGGGASVTSSTGEGSPVTAAAASTGAGGDHADPCLGDLAGPVVLVHVFVPDEVASTNPATDFLTTRKAIPPAGWASSPIGMFKLYTSDNGRSDMKLLMDCNDTAVSHTIVQGNLAAGECECLGYALSGSTGNDGSHVPMLQLKGSSGGNTILPTSATSACTKHGNGDCPSSDLFTAP